MTFESKINERPYRFLHISFIKLKFDSHGAIFPFRTKKGAFDMESVLETTMLVCFGFSWPMNVIKAYKARTARGTSLPFILLIIAGYLAGIAAKLLTGNINYVLVAYLLNLAIVMTGVIVYFRNKALDKRADAMKPGAIKSEQVKIG